MFSCGEFFQFFGIKRDRYSWKEDKYSEEDEEESATKMNLNLHWPSHWHSEPQQVWTLLLNVIPTELTSWNKQYTSPDALLPFTVVIIIVIFRCDGNSQNWHLLTPSWSVKWGRIIIGGSNSALFCFTGPHSHLVSKRLLLSCSPSPSPTDQKDICNLHQTIKQVIGTAYYSLVS